MTDIGTAQVPRHRCPQGIKGYASSIMQYIPDGYPVVMTSLVALGG